MNTNYTKKDDNQATYCPEDNKLRLYVGRVPRDEYLALKKEGWKSTPKQDCDFVATWSPDREQTALCYAYDIDDEDQSPTDRAADRAERFALYRDKRRAEANSYADNYDSKPLTHGYQSQIKAEREAKKHEKTGIKACSQWDKAEYWQTRTAGVISNALYKLSPRVRMGRIKELEKDIRKIEETCKNRNDRYDYVLNSLKNPNRDKARKTVYLLLDKFWNVEYTHPITEQKGSIYGIDPNEELTLEQLRDMYLSKHQKVELKDYKWYSHSVLRLAYETQMLKSAGGTLGQKDLEVGGWIGSYQIHKVNKSTKSGRVVSIDILVPAVEGWAYKINNIPGTDKAYMNVDVEKLTGEYKEPTEEDKEAIKNFKKSIKKDKKPTIPLINPDFESATKLQNIINLDEAEKIKRWGGKNPENTKPVEMTMAAYKARSRGEYSPCGTGFFDEEGKRPHKRYYGHTKDGAVCKVRIFSSVCGSPDRVIVITDKPQKALPEFKTTENTESTVVS